MHNLHAHKDSAVDFEKELEKTLSLLRKRMKEEFHRHVPTGTLLYDRWQLARFYGFGEGSSVYDESLILGDVKVGKESWIGPFTVLDGAHAPLTIGHHTHISSGVQIYTHNTVAIALTGGKGSLFKRPTKIGNCCFIGPRTIIGPGTVIGDHCFVAAASYVEGVFPDYSYISGSPAKKTGVVEIQDTQVRFKLFKNEHTGT